MAEAQKSSSTATATTKSGGSVYVTHNMLRNGEKLSRGDSVTDLSDSERKKLLKMGAVSEKKPDDS